jgi:hypothetical protein
VASASKVPNLCGVAFYDITYTETGGYSHLRRPVPLYLVNASGVAESRRGLGIAGAAFNAVLAPEDMQQRLPPEYRKRSCSAALRPERDDVRDDAPHRLCTFVRTGGCDPAAAPGQRLEKLLLRNNL